MIQSLPLTSRYDGVVVESVRKRRRTHNRLKIRPNNAEKNHSNVFKSKLCSDTSTSLTSSEMINSVAPKREKTFSTMVTSFEQSSSIPQQKLLCTSKITPLSETLISSSQDSDAFTNNNNEYQQLKHGDQPKKCNPLWKYILTVLSGILGVLLLVALILPSLLVYLLAPKSSQTGLSELPAYTNHCAGISSRSLWQADTATTITMTINTSQCQFNDIPLYFVSIAGTSNHYCLTGYGAIYLPTKESFQIYAESTCAAWNATSMLSYAAMFGWDVNWMGFYK